MAVTPSNFYPGLSPYQQMFTDYLIDKRAVEPFVVSQYPYFNLYNRLLEFLGEKAQEKRSGQRLYEIYHEGNDYPAALIAGRAESGTALIITWDNMNFTSLRPGNAVISAVTGTWGVVRTTSPGQAVIDFYYSPAGNTAFTSSDFVIGTTASDRGDISNVINSGSKERLIFSPFRTTNLVGQMRHTASLSYDELNTLTYIDGPNGQPYYASTHVLQNMKYASQIQAVRNIDGIFNNDPRYPSGGGFQWQIQNQGGVSFPLTEAITEENFQLFIDQLIANGGQIGSELLMVCGSSFMGYFQRFMKQYIITAGVNNTVGGATVKGIDITTYAYNGKVIKLMVDPLMDNPQVWMQDYSTIVNGALKRSHSAFVFDTSPVQTENSGTVPFMVKYYFGQTPIFMSKVNGLITLENNVATVATNSTMSSNLEIVYNCTIQLMNPAAHGYIFLAA